MNRGIQIEPLDFKHAKAVQALASDPAIGATSNVPSPYPADGAVSWIRHASLKRAQGADYCFAVIDGAGTVVGACSLIDVDKKSRSAELGYWIGKPYWGKGYATAAGRRVLAFGFNEIGLRRVVSNCLMRNRASYRVLEKLGFRF